MAVDFIGGGNQSTRRKLYHMMLYWVHSTWVRFELTMLVVISSWALIAKVVVNPTTIRSRPWQPLHTCTCKCIYDFNHIVLQIRTPYDCLIESIFFSGNTISNLIFIIPSLAGLYFAFIDHMEYRYKWCNASVFSMYLSIFKLFVYSFKVIKLFSRTLPLVYSEQWN